MSRKYNFKTIEYQRIFVALMLCNACSYNIQTEEHPALQNRFWGLSCTDLYNLYIFIPLLLFFFSFSFSFSYFPVNGVGSSIFLIGWHIFTVLVVCQSNLCVFTTLRSMFPRRSVSSLQSSHNHDLTEYLSGIWLTVVAKKKEKVAALAV